MWENEHISNRTLKDNVSYNNVCVEGGGRDKHYVCIFTMGCNTTGIIGSRGYNCGRINGLETR